VRICGVYSLHTTNANYRVLTPLRELARRGHDVTFVELDERGRFDPERLQGHDVIHVYRRCEPQLVKAIEAQRALGTAITWDNDDDPRLIPPESPVYKEIGGFQSAKEFRKQRTMMSRAHLVTTTSRVLAERYAADIDGETQVIENYLSADQVADPAGFSDAKVIGWVAGLEHRADAQKLQITETLRRVMERMPDVRVITVGVQLRLDADRYRHIVAAEFGDLPSIIRQFDVGIAPLSDIPMSAARSNIKVKEYAACGVPWLASARGPYVGLGEGEGGQLLGDDEWEEGLVRFISARFRRRGLRRRAKSWAKSQLIGRHVGEWEAALDRAIQHASRQVA
jgi:glycosyltransferase involved in cell wall biosynthesis